MNSVRTRKTHARGKPRKKVEPLDEGITGKMKRRKYSADELKLIKRRYFEFVKKGLNDAEISKRISEEITRSAGSVREKIKKMRENGEIERNPNKGNKRFSDEEIELIKKSYLKLIKEGLNDKRIAKKIGKELGRQASSVDKRIREIRKDGEIGENPNRGRKKFGDKEIELIKRRYIELVKEELNDREIARKIGKELGRSTRSVEGKIRRIRENKKIVENPNNQETRPYIKEEVEFIKKRYTELVQEGLNDHQIAKKISREFGRSVRSVGHRIIKMREDKKIGENPNKQKTKEPYTEEEIESIKKRYAELVKEGLHDAEISKRISEEIGRDVESLGAMIRKFRKKGKIDENPNKGNNPFSDQEIELIKKRYNELVKEGLNDKQIAKKIAEELGRQADSVENKMWRIRKDEDIGENPHMFIRKEFNNEEIELIKKRYNELVKEELSGKQIARKIGNELGRSASSVESKIIHMRKAGEFADAEALREREDILGVVKALEEFGEE